MLNRPLVVALLDSFYTSSPRHWGTLAPLWWHPQDSSVSSRNLRKFILPNSSFVCINSCPYIEASANAHGRPEPLYVAALLRRLWPYDLLLVCGRVAKSTYRLSPFKGEAPVLFIPHPAWRAWSASRINEVQQQIVQAVNPSCQPSLSFDSRSG